MDIIFLLLGILILTVVWFESLRIREFVIKHCKQLCRESDLQLLDQTVALVSLTLKRADDGNLRLLRRFQFEVSENGVDRFSGYVSLLGNSIIESHLEGPDGQNTFHQSRPPSLH